MQPESDRLTSLDGIRGIAIISVFLNHVNTGYINFPQSLSVIPNFLFASGVMGVSFLFLLSGFLMAYIYPAPGYKMLFLQKRYTRIFPLFLTMSAVSWVFFLFPQLSWYVKILLIVSLALITRFLWVNIIKRIDSKSLSTKFFISFLILQILVGIYYALWIMRHPPIYLNQQLPEAVKNATIGLVNSTLTLPLGNLVPMLDGTYWSLASEVFFYILFPIICAPVIFYLLRKGVKVKALFVLSLFPLIAGFDVLSHHVLLLSMLQFQLFAYFITGMSLAYLYKNRRSFIENFSGKFAGKANVATIPMFFFLIISGHLIQNSLPKSFSSWFDIAMAIPFALILAIGMNKKTQLHKFLSSKILAFLGLISYSVYLSHTPIIHIIEPVLRPSGIISNLGIISITLAVTLGISFYLYKMIEKPYFTELKSQRAKINSDNYKVTNKNIYTIFFSVIFVYLILTFAAFESSFNFFSKQDYISDIKLGSKSISLADQDLNFKFTATQNNLGLVIMHIKRVGVPPKKPAKDYELTFKIKEDNSKDWYAQVKYNMGEIGDSPSHVFGFPVIQNSNGKTYQVVLTQPKENYEYIVINPSDSNLRSVYFLNKSDLLKNPKKFLGLVGNRFVTAISNKEAQYALLLFMPFLLVSLFLVFQDKLNHGKR